MNTQARHIHPRSRLPTIPITLSTRRARITKLVNDGHYREAIQYLENHAASLSASDITALLAVVWFDYTNILTGLLGFCDLSVAELATLDHPSDYQVAIRYTLKAKELARRIELLQQISDMLYLSKSEV